MSDLQDRLGASFDSRYRLERELGGGGMSRVFLAEELALGRTVVIKVLPPEFGAALSPERFEREVRLAARLQHPHIVPLLAAGSADGVLYYTMPFVAGESLRARLDREGPLPVADVIRYLHDVADALVGAHAQDIVHRDIKPDNVLLTHNHAVITDFGIARAVTEARGGELRTETGIAVGTPAYMAPEQATGDAHLDHRADIYALGVLGYEMLAGEPPFRGPNIQAVIAAHLTRAPTPLAQVRANVPPALAALLARCMEKLPADRIGSAAELLAQLELLAPGSGEAPARGGTAVMRTAAPPKPFRVALLFALAGVALIGAVYVAVRLLGLPDWVTVATVALLAIGFPIVIATGHHELKRTSGLSRVSGESPFQRLLTWRRALGAGAAAFAGLGIATALFMGLRASGVGPFATLLSAGTLEARKPLVVADFENRTPDSTLSQSITEALRIDLSRSHAVRLLESSDVAAALRRMERSPDAPLTGAVAREVAQREGAQAVVVGDIAPIGPGYSLSVRLVGTADGATLLAERETADGAAGLIAAVDRLSRKLREGIGESLRTIRAGEPLEQVTTSSLEALKHYTQGDHAMDLGDPSEARSELEAAIALDSNFAMAYRKLGVVLSNIDAERTLQVAAVRRAYDLRARLPERERLQAIAGYHMILRDPPDTAIAMYRQLLETWPTDKVAINNLAFLLYVARRYPEAEEVALRGLVVMPNAGTLYDNALAALVAQRKFALADSVFARYAAAQPHSGFRLGDGVELAYAEGKYPLALEYADSLAGLAGPATRTSHFLKAIVNRRRGRFVDAAREEQAVMAQSFKTGDVAGGITAAVRLAEADWAFRGRPDAALGRVDSVLAAYPMDSLPPGDRPYLFLADFYSHAGRPARAAAMVADFDRLVAPDIRKGDLHRPFTEGLLLRAEGKTGEAAAQLRSLHGPCVVCPLYETGQLFEAMRQPDSALAVYEQLVTTPMLEMDLSRQDFTVAPALRRLGELYEAKGERDKALDYYGKFVTLWKDADPDLQPIVADVKQRMAVLAGEPRRP